MISYLFVRSQKSDEVIMERLQFHSFSTLPPECIDTTLLHFEFEDLLNDFLFPVRYYLYVLVLKTNQIYKQEVEGEGLITFGDRYYLEEIDHDILLQTISGIPKCVKTDIIASSYPYLSATLLAIHLAVPSTRIDVVTEWKPKNISTISFGSWSKSFPLEGIEKERDILKLTYLY
jgi:hypothetical protein